MLSSNALHVRWIACRKADCTYPITASLGLAEDQDLAAIHFLLQQLQQAGILVTLLQEDKVLRNSMVGFQLRGANCDSVGIPQEVCCNGLHLFWPGGTPQQTLPVWSNLQAARLCTQETDKHRSVNTKQQLLCYFFAGEV